MFLLFLGVSLFISLRLRGVLGPGDSLLCVSFDLGIVDAEFWLDVIFEGLWDS